MAILAMLALAVPVLIMPRDSADLMALWIAAEVLADGQAHLVYPSPSVPFEMRPPEAWAPLARGLGHEGELYPYLYPPLWAALLAEIRGIGPVAFTWAATLLNPLLLLGGSVLAWRALRPALPLLPFVAIGQAALYGTYIGAIAVLQNQVQVLVAILTILALERSRAGAPRAAGAALALAAAIKLYPALFVLFWLAARRWREARSFAIAGALLAGLSVALAGWPLHREFLALIGSISASALGIALSFGLDAVLLDAFFTEAARLVPPMQAAESGGLAEGRSGGWLALAKPAWWQALSRLGLLAALVSGAILLRRSAAAGGTSPAGALAAPEALAWGAGMIAVTLFLPLAWGYYFIAPLLLAPALIDPARPARGALFLVAILFPLSLGCFYLLDAAGITLAYLSEMGFAAMVALGLGLARAARPRARARRVTAA